MIAAVRAVPCLRCGAPSRRDIPCPICSFENTADEARRDLLRTATHELGHVVVSRALGYTVDWVDLRPAPSSRGCASLNGGQSYDAVLPGAVDSAVHYLAGPAAEILTPADTSGRLADIGDDEEQAARLVASIAGLPPDAAADIAYRHARPRDATDQTDEQKAAFWAEAAGREEQFQLFSFCRARASRMVLENAAQIVALLPFAVRRMVFTGDELDQAIQALNIPATTQKGPLE